MAIEWVHRVVLHCSEIKDTAQVVRGSATSMPLEDETVELILTDPPYYDAVPYADLGNPRRIRAHLAAEILVENGPTLNSRL